MSSVYRLWNAHLILLKRSKKPPHIQMVHMIYSILYTYIHVWRCKLASFWCLTAMHRFPIVRTYGPVPNLHVAVQRSPNSKGVCHTAPIPSDVGLRRAETDSFGCWSLVKTSETAAKSMQNPPEKLKKWKSGVFYGFFQIFRWCFLMLPFLVLISWIGFFCEISGGLKLLSQQTTIAKSILEDQMVGGRRNRKRPKAAPSHNLLPNNPPIQSIDAHNQHFPCWKIP